jgi:hypothetical protein
LGIDRRHGGIVVREDGIEQGMALDGTALYRRAPIREYDQSPVPRHTHLSPERLWFRLAL